MYLNEKSAKALENLKGLHRPVDLFQATQRSAVLIALLANSMGDLEVILTVRSLNLRIAAGESAFPGDKQDPEDIDLIATAKREALEEIHLLPSDSQLLTVMAPVLSLQLHVVTPVVVFCPNMTTSDLSLLHPNPGEVAVIFTVSLESFLSPITAQHNWLDRFWLQSAFRIHRFDRCGSKNYVLQVNEGSKTNEGSNAPASTTNKDPTRSDGWLVYGLTANLLIEVATIAYQREPDFEVHAPAQVKRFGIRSSL